MSASSSGFKLEQDHKAVLSSESAQTTSCLKPPRSPGKPKAFENSCNGASSSEVIKARTELRDGSANPCGCHESDPVESHARESGVAVNTDGDHDHDWEDFGTELFKDFVSEMDVWEEESAMERTEKALKTTSPSSNLEEQVEKTPPLARPSPPSLNERGNLSAGVCNASSTATTTTTTTAALGSAAQLNPTPSRSQFVTHVTPLTLFPASAASTLSLHHRGFYGADKESLRSENSKASKLSSASLGSVVREGRSIRSDSPRGNVVTIVGETPPPLETGLQRWECNSSEYQTGHNACMPPHTSPPSNPSPSRIKETPPLEHGNNPPCRSASPVGITNSLTKPKNLLVSGESFKTPNSAQWLKLKNSFSPSSPSRCSSSSGRNCPTHSSEGHSIHNKM